MPEEISALAGIKTFQELGESTFKPFDGPFRGGSQEALEFGECQFEPVEVGLYGGRWQIDESSANAFDGSVNVDNAPP